MGLLDNQTQGEYYAGNDFGTYQFVTLENVISTANKNNIEVSVCGEMSSDSISASALYALGLRVFSMSPSSAPFVFQQLNKIKDMDLKKIKIIY